MRYMLLTYGDEQAPSDAEPERRYQQSAELAHRLNQAGQPLAAAPLHPTATATRVRVREGKRLVTHGPFAETREQLGGYFPVEARDLDEAMAIAEWNPRARQGTVELRPVIETPGLSPGQPAAGVVVAGTRSRRCRKLPLSPRASLRELRVVA